MVTKFDKHKKEEYDFILDFLKNNFNYDFYITHNNVRNYISDMSNLKMFLKECKNVFVLQEDENFKGLISIWESTSDFQRNYIKINALNKDACNKLLTVLLWNTKKDLYIKLRKDSNYIEVFKNKGFKFQGGRGCQILLKRKYRPELMNSKVNKEAHSECNNSNNTNIG